MKSEDKYIWNNINVNRSPVLAEIAGNVNQEDSKEVHNYSVGII